MSIKNQSIGALFVALIVILAVNPKIVNNIYSSILGRLFLISMVIFFSMNNVTLGLLLLLAIITALNQFGSFVEATLPLVEATLPLVEATLPLVEAMENETPVTIGEENVDTEGTQKVLTASATKAVKQKISDLKKTISEGTLGVDKEDIKMAIMPKDSKQIPVDPNMNSSSEVSASSSGMLNSNSETLEGFKAYAELY